MKCPVCGAKTSESKLTCDVCEALLKGQTAQDRPDDSVHATSHSVQRGGPGDPGSATYAKGTGTSKSSSQAAVATRIVEIEKQGDRHTRMVEVPVPAVVKRALRAREREGPKRTSSDGQPRAATEDLDESETLIDEAVSMLGRFYRKWTAQDRRTWWACLAGFVGSFLPWANTAHRGLVSGVEGYGVGSVAAAVCAVLCLVGRAYRRRFSTAWVGLQVVASLGIVAAPIYAVFSGLGGHPHVGLVVTVIAGLAALVFSVARAIGS